MEISTKNTYITKRKVGANINTNPMYALIEDKLLQMNVTIEDKKELLQIS